MNCFEGKRMDIVSKWLIRSSNGSGKAKITLANNVDIVLHF